MKQIITHRPYILSVYFFLCTIAIMAQTSNIDWAAEGYLVQGNGTNSEIISHLTKQGTTITWAMTGSDVRSFTISSVKGSWDIQDKLGELNYSFSMADTIASLSLKGSDEGVFILLNIVHMLSGEPDESYSFYIETLTAQNQ